MPAPHVREVQRCIVQAGTTLSDNLADWTTLEWLEFDSYDEGADQVIGWAGFHAGFGRRTPYGHATPQVVGLPQVLGVPAPEWLGGRLIRVLVEDPGGDVTIGEVDYTMAWVGPVSAVEVFPDGGDDETSGGLVQVTAVGVGALLDQCTVRTGQVVNGAGDALVVTWRCPPFNALPYGDHVEFGGGHAHNLSDQEVTDFWTARQALEYLLENMGGTIAWSVSDPDGCLGYQLEACDFHGWTLFQVLVFLTTRRGLTFHLRPLGSFVTILIRSTSSEAITVGDFTMPASSVTCTFDLRGDVWYSEPSLSYDHASVYDLIQVEGSHPLVGLTVLAWEAGFSAPEVAAWDDNPKASGTENVHRLFRIAATWQGGNAEAPNGLRDQLVATTSDAFGQTGLTGVRQWSESPEFPPARALVIEPFIPWSESYGYELAGDRPAPVVVVETGSGKHLDATQFLGWGVEVLARPAAIRLVDNFDGAEIKGYTNFAGDQVLRVTLGIREPYPLIVSWRRPESDWPRPAPRIKTVQVPGFEQWIVLAGTVTGVNDDGTLRTLETQRTIRDDVPRMHALLALLRAQYTEPTVSMSLTDRGIVDTSATYRPGTLVTTVETGATTLRPNGIITRRGVRRVARDGVPMFDTHYVTEQRGVNLEAVL